MQENKGKFPARFAWFCMALHPVHAQNRHSDRIRLTILYLGAYVVYLLFAARRRDGTPCQRTIAFPPQPKTARRHTTWKQGRGFTSPPFFFSLTRTFLRRRFQPVISETAWW